MGKKMISIWYFVGLILTIYGVLITGAGIYDLINPSPQPVVLSNLHAGIWWGLLLIGLGILYIVKFRPKKTKG